MAGVRLSAFDVIGPVMVGPSSSHTAGAARIGLLARRLLGGVPVRARLELHGSFAATGRGHATDRALVAGLLGMASDDADLPRALELAPLRDLEVEFAVVDLGPDVHPNTAKIIVTDAEGVTLTCVASSLGGGIVELSELDGYTTALRGGLDTLVCWHDDKSGFLARLTAVLACVDVNIAALRTARHDRGTSALTVIETDGPVPLDAFGLLSRMTMMRRLRALPPW